MTLQSFEALIATASVLLLFAATRQLVVPSPAIAGGNVVSIRHNWRLIAITAMVLLIVGFLVALAEITLSARAPRQPPGVQRAVHRWTILGVPGESRLDLPQRVDLNESFPVVLSLSLPKAKTPLAVSKEILSVKPQLTSLGIQFTNSPRGGAVQERPRLDWRWTWYARPMSEGKQIIVSSFVVTTMRGKQKATSNRDGPISTLQVTKPLAFDTRLSVASLCVTLFFSTASLVVSVLGLKKAH